MSSVKRMYVVPAEFFDSLLKRQTITEDPLLTSQVKIETRKKKY